MVNKDTLRRVAELSVDAARQGGSLALKVARRVAEPLVERRRSSDAYSPAPAAARPDAPEPPLADVLRAAPPAPAPDPAPAAPSPAAASAAADPPAAAPAAAAPEAEAAHVDREAIVVAESSDPGADEGVGAQIRIDEPWDGYDELNVKQVSAQLADAGTETLAVVRLYESANRNRRTVLDAIDKRMAATSA